MTTVSVWCRPGVEAEMRLWLVGRIQMSEGRDKDDIVQSYSEGFVSVELEEWGTTTMLGLFTDSPPVTAPVPFYAVLVCDDPNHPFVRIGIVWDGLELHSCDIGPDGDAMIQVALGLDGSPFIAPVDVEQASAFLRARETFLTPLTHSAPTAPGDDNHV